MGITVVYLLMLQKHISSDQMILKLKKTSLVFRKGFKGFYEKNVNNMKKTKKTKTQTGLNGYVYKFFVDYNIIDISSIIIVNNIRVN